MKKKILSAISLALAFIMSLSLVAAAAEIDYGAKLDEAISIYKSFSLFANDETDYVRETLIEMFEDDPELFYDFVNRIYGKHDRYSKFLTPQVYDETYELSNTMVGIGVVITTSEEGLLEVQSLSDGPALLAGIQPGDKLLEADGINIKGCLPSEAASIIKGKEGTTVNLKILRGEEKLSFNIRRAVIDASEISYSYISDKIAYMKLSHFDGISAFIDFMEAYDEFEEKGINTVILDLRNNPGGQLDCLINMMDNIIPEKDVPYLMSWQTKPLKLTTYVTEGYGWEFNKFIILVNKQTASAAEIMAGSLRDLGYAVIVGEKTFGKGMGQIHTKASDGDEAIVTTFELKLPVSGGYDELGISPDYEVALRTRPYKLPYLTALKTKSDASKIKPENVRPVEERLRELGYFYATPDDVWDEATVRAINVFCRENNLNPVSNVCKWDIIEKIDEAAHNLEYKYVIEDAQLERAIELAEEYVKSDKKAKCVDASLIDFRRD